MPFLFNKNSILETIREHPYMARRLWIEAGYEGTSDECIKEAKKRGVSFRILPGEVFLKKFQGAKSHICLERDDVSYVDPDTFLEDIKSVSNPLICALDGIYDPQNLGNIIRSAACLEVNGVIIPKDRSCGITETVTGISRGAIEHVKIVRVVNLSRYLEEMKEIGIFCYGMDERGAVPLWKADLIGPVCLVFGKEEGLRRLTRERCDEILKIPTCNAFPSLNVATSFALSVYEARRQRQPKETGKKVEGI
jgi:23S rRNA (guanosine2251-2'-O)-methyltransferase